MYAFLGITTALLIFLSALLGYGRRQEIIANWKDYRFKPLIMLSAFLYKPDDDPRSRWQFAEDNFRDGVLRNVTAALKTVLGPLLNVFVVMGTSLDQSSKNVESVKRVTEATAATFEGMFSIFEQRFISTLHGLRMTFLRLNTAMQRMWAAAVNSIWQAYSATSAIMSTVDLIIKIVIIILVVLLAMLIFLFLFMWPFIPIILSVVGILVTAGAGAAVGGMASTFCFGPGALVCMADGTFKSIAAVELGDKLSDGGHVTATFKFEGGSVRDLYGIPVTDEHLVFCEGKPIRVADHPDLRMGHEISSNLYCLNTSTHRIPVWSLTHAKQVLFADWEELDDDDEDGLQTWACHVFETLNPGHPVPEHFTTHDEALFHPDTSIATPDGPKDIRHIHPGMLVLDADGNSTRVTGVVKGLAPRVTNTRGISPCAWVRTSPTGCWVQVGSVFEVEQSQSASVEATTRPWMSLFTEAGSFYLNEHRMAMRDFSDIGVENLHDQTEWILQHMLGKLITK